MRIFHLNREIDESGVSGTGIVAEGVQLSNGACVLSWLTKPKGWDSAPVGVGVYESIRHVEAVHGHDGKTHVEWLL